MWDQVNCNPPLGWIWWQERDTFLPQSLHKNTSWWRFATKRGHKPLLIGEEIINPEVGVRGLADSRHDVGVLFKNGVPLTLWFGDSISLLHHSLGKSYAHRLTKDSRGWKCSKTADILRVPEDSENGLCLDRTFPQDPSYVAMMRQAH